MPSVAVMRPNQWCSLMRSERAFAQRAESTGLRYSLSRRFEGYNISIGKPVSLTVFRSQVNQ